MALKLNDRVYHLLCKEVGNDWVAVNRKIQKALEGKDVLAAAQIKHHVANLVDMLVEFDEDEMGTTVKVVGFLDWLMQGDLYVDPKTKKLVMAGENGSPWVAPNPIVKGTSDIVRRISDEEFLCRRFGTWFRVTYHVSIDEKDFHHSDAYFGHIDFLKQEISRLAYTCEPLSKEELRVHQLAS